jgi:uncharacterized protein YoxC
MILTVVFFIIGIFIGITIRDQKSVDKYNKTFDQIDTQIKKDLELYKNLSESYKQDCERYKLEIQKLKNRNGS